MQRAQKVSSYKVDHSAAACWCSPCDSLFFEGLSTKAFKPNDANMTLNAVLVEDSRTIRDTLTPALSELANMEVVAVAETAKDAIDTLTQRAEEWHVAIVDLFLKQGSGLEVLTACKARRSNQKVIVLSNYATADIRRRCSALGADAVFDKSTELDNFFDFCVSLSANGGH